MAEQIPATFMERHHFLLRRLHSLLGVIPIGVFLFPHLITNSSVVWGIFLGENNYGHGGVEMFQHEVSFIHGLPALPLIEWGGLFIPLLLHGLLGILFALSGKQNVLVYKYRGNFRYVLQRLSGYIGFVFIFMHISSLRYGWEYGGLMTVFSGHNAASSTAVHFQNGMIGIIMALVYFVCVLSLVYHFANGLWTAAITWGLTVTAQAQKRWGYVCTIIGLGLGTATIMAIIGFSTLDIDNAAAVENRINTGQTIHVDQVDDIDKPQI